LENKDLNVENKDLNVASLSDIISEASKCKEYDLDLYLTVLDGMILASSIPTYSLKKEGYVPVYSSKENEKCYVDVHENGIYKPLLDLLIAREGYLCIEKAGAGEVRYSKKKYCPDNFCLRFPDLETAVNIIPDAGTELFNKLCEWNKGEYFCYSDYDRLGALGLVGTVITLGIGAVKAGVGAVFLFAASVGTENLYYYMQYGDIFNYQYDTLIQLQKGISNIESSVPFGVTAAVLGVLTFGTEIVSSYIKNQQKK